MAKRKLTPLQERFKNNILKGMDAKTAYIKAGYKARGAAAEVNASRLLRNAKVKATIDEAQKRAAQRAEVTCERILEEYAKIAFLNPKRIFDRKGKLKKVHEIDDDLKNRRPDRWRDKQSIDIGVRLEDVLAALPEELRDQVSAKLSELVSPRAN
ncbi:MAG: terminase small subunit [Deltaproteobacteria bacterium]